ncbi:hypothetical protein [Actinomadura sp. 6N118]|uniref:hypothetical protein n=1 Tax=Actinomadura sp. 6N118 TaxID=3375151 RepID=UPI00379B017D
MREQAGKAITATARRVMAGYRRFWRRVDAITARVFARGKRFWTTAATVVMVGVVLVQLVLIFGPAAGTSKQATRTGATPGASRGLPKRVPVVMPYRTHGQVRRALTRPEQAGRFRPGKLERHRLGLVRVLGVPVCGWGGVKIPGKVIEMYGRQARRGAIGQDAYAVHAVAYPSLGQARQAFTTLEQAARACPARKWSKRRQWPDGMIGFEHTQRWQITGSGKGPNWASLRAIEHDTYPRGNWTWTVAYRVIDYIQRGNVLVVQTLHMYRTPHTPDGPTLTWAANLLNRTVHNLGGTPFTWLDGNRRCDISRYGN